VRSEEALAQGVERACADVTVNDADGRERERKELAWGCDSGRQGASNRPTGLADGLEVEVLFRVAADPDTPHKWFPRDDRLTTVLGVNDN
jgi:hypothetical protein